MAVFKVGSLPPKPAVNRNFNLAVVPQVCLECCRHSLDHEVLEQIHKLQKNKTGSVLAPRTVHVKGCRMGPKSATACIASLHVACKIILVDFNLMVSTPTAKL